MTKMFSGSERETRQREEKKLNNKHTFIPIIHNNSKKREHVNLDCSLYLSSDNKERKRDKHERLLCVMVVMIGGWFFSFLFDL